MNGGRFPVSLGQLADLPESDTQDLSLLDPWGHDYLYEPPAAGRPWPGLYCLGSDGMPGGSGMARDISLADAIEAFEARTGADRSRGK